MKGNTTKKLILSLIRDDIRCAKLLAAFNRLGMRTDDYDLDLSDTIFQLMGIDGVPRNEPIYRNYIVNTGKAAGIDTSRQSFAFNRFVIGVYRELLSDYRARHP